MTPTELRDLLSQREGLKLDFKREYHLSKKPPPDVNEKDWAKLVNGQRHELIKDILALTNGNVGTAEEPGYLIIGGDDDKYLQLDGTRPLFDMRHLQLTSSGILQMVNEACYPPVPDILCEGIELDGKIVVTITIPPSPHVHETSKPLNCVGGTIDRLTGRLSVSEGKPITARTAFIRRVDGVYPASEAERRALAADKSPETFIIATESLNLDEFVVSELEREKVRSIFFPPRDYAKAEEILGRAGRLWIVGPSGLWKRYLALSLALKHQVLGEIYRVPRYIEWAQLAATEVRDSTIIFPDPLGLIQYEGEKVESEFRPWDKLRANGNLLIATSSDEVFAEAAKETRLSEFVPKDEVFSLNADSFDYRAKAEIFKRLIRYSDDQRIISESQKVWALGLVDRDGHDGGKGVDAMALGRAQMRRLLREIWLPIDIERFVADSLPNAGSEGEVFDLLQRDSDIEKRVRSWFSALDDSARCFVLTLSIFSGFEDKEIWWRHQKIVESLRRLDPGLSAPPLGILRQRAQPYVTSEGSLEFVNSRVFRVVLKEVAKTYREYFTDIEVMKLMKEWSIPDLPTTQSKEERDNLIKETEEVRNAIARMTGEMGKSGLGDVMWLLKEWATHRIGRIGKTAGIALREMAKDPASAHQALALLNEWSADTSAPDVHNLRWASASALGRIASLKSQFGTSEQALTILQRLAVDQSDYVVSAVPQAFRMMGSALPVEALGGVLTRLAKRDRFTQQEVARTLDEASGQRAESVCKLLDTWVASRNVNVRKTAILTLLTGRKLPREERHPRLIKLLVADLGLVFETLHEVIEEANDEHRQAAQSVLAGLGAYSPEARGQLVSALANAYEKNPSRTQQLFDRLSSSGDARLRDIQFEVHAKASNVAIKTLLKEPSEQRHPFLAQLLKTNPNQFVLAILEALETETHGNIDWLLSSSLGIPSPFGDLSGGALSGVGKEIQYVADKLREIEVDEVDDIMQKISAAREEAVKAGIKDFAHLDKQLEEVTCLSASKSYVNIWKAKGVARAAYSATLPSWEDQLTKQINAKSTALKRLKTRRSDEPLRQEVKAKTDTIGWLISLATLLVALTIGYGLFATLVEPARTVTFPRDVRISGISYPGGSQFEVIDENDSEICLEMQSNKKCLDKAATLRIAEVKESYTTKALLLIMLIALVILTFWFLVSLAVTREYRNRFKRDYAGKLGKEIKQTENDIKRLSAAKDYLMSLPLRLQLD